MSLIINQSDNSQIPSQPEYGKAYKPQFNHGCCPNCKESDAPICTTMIQSFTRYSQDSSLVITVTKTGGCPCQNEAPATGCKQAPETIDCSSINA